MIRVWAIAFLVWFVLPFHLLGREMTVYGFAILLLFILTFCGGALVAAIPQQQRMKRAEASVDFNRADVIIKIVATISIIVLSIEFSQGQYLDLQAAWTERSDRAIALANGSQSSSSLFFQLGFLTYPIAYSYVVRSIGFQKKINLWAFAFFGMAPIGLASLVLGGRAPLAYGILLAFLAIGIRRRMLPTVRKTGGPRNLLLYVGIAFITLIALNYFIQVFFIRAGGIENIDVAYDNAALQWGVTFDGPGFVFLQSVLGKGNTFLVFIFAWYSIQGIVMSNVLFTSYVGPPAYGVYGIEFATALMRRIDGSFVFDRFSRLLDLNTYGFLPSAFGSTYVDLSFFALITIAGWGWLVGRVYRKIRQAEDFRWLFMGPFVTLGIVFSLVNTPIGFVNGLTTHFWMIVIFFAARPIVSWGVTERKHEFADVAIA